jgi:hypothetical protein
VWEGCKSLSKYSFAAVKKHHAHVTEDKQFISMFAWKYKLGKNVYFDYFI